MTQSHRLRELLETAVQALREMGDADNLLCQFETAASLADHIEGFVIKLQTRDLTAEELSDVFLVFGPTGYFDDYCRGNLADVVLEVIEELEKTALPNTKLIKS